MLKHREIKAFILLEIAIALTVIGIIASLYLPGLIRQQLIKKREKTLTNIDKVYLAIDQYVIDEFVKSAQQRTKIPGNPSKPSNSNKPIKLPNPANKDGGAITPNDPFLGYVPYVELHLNKEDSLDGFGNPLRYVYNSRKQDDQRLKILDEKRIDLNEKGLLQFD